MKAILLTLAVSLAAAENVARGLAENMQFKYAVDGTTSGQCYAPTYTYYTSFKCNADTNCGQGQSYCDGLTDPSDNTAELKRAEDLRLVAIILPSIIGGTCLLTLLCICCCGYFGFQKILEFIAKQKRVRGRPKRQGSK